MRTAGPYRRDFADKHENNNRPLAVQVDSPTPEEESKSSKIKIRYKQWVSSRLWNQEVE